MLDVALLADIEKEGEKIFKEFVLLPHLFFSYCSRHAKGEAWITLTVGERN